jgi:transcriptional regulator with XRE-family HTH domain
MSTQRKQVLGRFEDWQERQFQDPTNRKEYTDLHKRGMVAYRLLKLRKASGMTQAEFARRMGMTQASLARIESGVGETVKLSTLEKAARAVDRQLSVSFERIPHLCEHCGEAVEQERAVWIGRLGRTMIGLTAVPYGRCRACGTEFAPQKLNRLASRLGAYAAKQTGGRRIRMGEAAVFDEEALEEVLQ